MAMAPSAIKYLNLKSAAGKHLIKISSITDFNERIVLSYLVKFSL